MFLDGNSTRHLQRNIIFEIWFWYLVCKIHRSVGRLLILNTGESLTVYLAYAGPPSANQQSDKSRQIGASCQICLAAQVWAPVFAELKVCVVFLLMIPRIVSRILSFVSLTFS